MGADLRHLNGVLPHELGQPAEAPEMAGKKRGGYGMFQS